MSDAVLAKYFSFQPYQPTENSIGCTTFSLVARYFPDGYEGIRIIEGDDVQGFTMNSIIIKNEEFQYTETEIIDIIKEKCKEFPEYIPKEDPKGVSIKTFTFDPIMGYDGFETMGIFNYNSMRSGIAMKTRRGNRAFRIFENTYMYVGTSIFDRPVIVSKNLDTGKYAVKFIETFSRYGVRVV